MTDASRLLQAKQQKYNREIQDPEELLRPVFQVLQLSSSIPPISHIINKLRKQYQKDRNNRKTDIKLFFERKIIFYKHRIRLTVRIRIIHKNNVCIQNVFYSKDFPLRIISAVCPYFSSVKRLETQAILRTISKNETPLYCAVSNVANIKTANTAKTKSIVLICNRKHKRTLPSGRINLNIATSCIIYIVWKFIAIFHGKGCYRTAENNTKCYQKSNYFFHSFLPFRKLPRSVNNVVSIVQAIKGIPNTFCVVKKLNIIPNAFITLSMTLRPHLYRVFYKQYR